MTLILQTPFQLTGDKEEGPGRVKDVSFLFSAPSAIEHTRLNQLTWLLMTEDPEDFRTALLKGSLVLVEPGYLRTLCPLSHVSPLWEAFAKLPGEEQLAALTTPLFTAMAELTEGLTRGTKNNMFSGSHRNARPEGYAYRGPTHVRFTFPEGLTWKGRIWLRLSLWGYFVQPCACVEER